MKETGIVRRYVGALLEVAVKSNEVEQTSEQLLGFNEAFQASRELREVLQNPAFTAEREKVLTTLFERMELSKWVKNFISLLVERSRVGLIDEMAQAFRESAEEKAGKVRAQVTVAVEPDEAKWEALTQALRQKLGKEVILEKNVDPEIIGGVVTRVGSTIYDSSIVSQLRRLKGVLAKEI